MTRGPRAGDAFGAMLLDELAARQADRPGVTEIVERDDGLLHAGPAGRYFTEPDGWAPFERAALDLATGRVLDVGGGAGRFALAVQDRGLEVTALDISPGAIEVCRRRGVRDLLVGSAPEAAAGAGRGSYDTFLMMGENLGLIGGPEQATAFLAGLAAASRPGARILGHGADPNGTADPAHARYRARNQAAGRLGGLMTIRIRYRDLATPWFRYLLCSPDELAELADGTPWQLTDVRRADAVNYLAVLSRRG